MSIESELKEVKAINKAQIFTLETRRLLLQEVARVVRKKGVIFERYLATELDKYLKEEE